MSANIVPAEDVLPYVLDKLGSTTVWTSQLLTEFDLVYQLESLSSLQIDAFGLHGVAALYISVRLCSEILYGDGFKPTVEIKALAHDKQYPQPLCSVVLSQINKTIEALFTDHWPGQSRIDTMEFLPSLYRHIQARIPLLGNFCVVCGRGHDQPYVGLKLTTCNSELCNDAFDEEGTGTDLGDIYSRPVTAELLISMASAGCRCTERRRHLFRSMPSSLFCKETEAQGDSTRISQKTDWRCLREAMKSMPAVAVMAKEPDLQKFFVDMALVPQTGMQRFRMPRWVLNCCRGHLMQLQGEDMFPTMATEYQFRLCTDRPSKEAAFSQLKEKYGSQFLFHGSPFYNWHSILQHGLKNMSNTRLMSNGKSHGRGIYLAKSSDLAAKHCEYEDDAAIPWYANSTFGKRPWCIALCEVINQSFNSRTDGEDSDAVKHRVVPDADRVITRYLFVYNNSNGYYPRKKIPDVQASTLREICERHAQTQTQILDAVKNAYQNL